jgi:predicted metalloprotease with PDZ domain
MKYTVHLEFPTQQYIRIEATFDVAKQDVIELQFPAWRPGRYELGNFAKNIKNFAVKDSQHKLLSFAKTSKDSWSINCENTDEILVSYLYYAAELNAGSTFMDDLQLYVNPVNCFIYDPQLVDEPCETKVVIPENFQIACGAEQAENIIYTASYHELVDSPFFASENLQHETYKVLGITFHIWVQGDVEFDWERVKADFEKFTLLQLSSFIQRRKKQSYIPFSEYHFMYQILPQKTYHGVEHQNSTVIALGPSEELMTTVYDDFLGVSSHELYHAWNVKAIRPIDMYPYDYSKENYSHLGFVAEGVTTYLGDWFLCHAGVKKFDWYKIEIEKLLQKHFDNGGRFNYSVAESSWDTWLDGYQLGAPNRKVSIYNEGALLAFALDIKIRAYSKNKHSLHDVMFQLYAEFTEVNKGYGVKDFQQVAARFAGEDLDDFFANYYFGSAPFESLLVETFEHIGFTLEMKSNPNLVEALLGLKTIHVGEKTVVQRMAVGGTAELAGIMHLDELTKINGVTIENNLHHLLANMKDMSIQLEVMRMGRKVQVLCPHVNRDFYPIYFMQKMKIPSKAAKIIFKRWCGYDYDEI